MKKKSILLLIMSAALTFGGMVCSAAVTPPYGPGQIGLSSVVLCDSLSLHESSDFSSAVVQTLKYGDRIITVDQANGWARVVLGDAEDSPSGWVNSAFIAIDPAWYKTEGDTSVYAWNDTAAPQVALLDAGTTLPILRDDGDWLVVSLRGAAGWICNPVRGTSGTSQNNSTSGNTSNEAGTASTDSNVSAAETSAAASQAAATEEQSSWFTIYAEDGITTSIHPTEGAMYEDAQGRTYVKQDEGYYYCITTDVTYAFDPGVWTGAIYGENEFPNE